MNYHAVVEKMRGERFGHALLSARDIDPVLVLPEIKSEEVWVGENIQFPFAEGKIFVARSYAGTFADIPRWHPRSPESEFPVVRERSHRVPGSYRVR